MSTAANAPVMNDPGFTSALAPQLQAYLAFKEKMGFYGASRIWYLKQFDAYCTAHGRTVFDRDTVEGWVSQRLALSGPYRSWMSYIRDVGRWLQAHGQRDAYVLSERWKAQRLPAHPYLLSTNEIEAFFAAAATLHAASPWRWQAVAFFTLMHCCGLRTGETRLLRAEHVHLRDRTLDVVNSKGNRSRRLPLTVEVTEVLAGCDRVTRTRFGLSRGTFFVSATGNPVTGATVAQIFQRIWDQAGLQRLIGGQQPRPYDLRHHFAYTNVERWMAQGKDVMAMLPYLARYMGHADIESSFYYIHTSPQFLHAYDQLTAASQSLLPEVGFDET
jgi:integrase